MPIPFWRCRISHRQLNWYDVVSKRPSHSCHWWSKDLVLHPMDFGGKPWLKVKIEGYIKGYRSPAHKPLNRSITVFSILWKPLLWTGTTGMQSYQALLISWIISNTWAFLGILRKRAMSIFERDCFQLYIVYSIYTKYIQMTVPTASSDLKI